MFKPPDKFSGGFLFLALYKPHEYRGRNQAKENIWNYRSS